jgi:hypothetical protein
VPVCAASFGAPGAEPSGLVIIALAAQHARRRALVPGIEDGPQIVVTRMRAQRPLLGVKRTWRGLVNMSANDPKRTFGDKWKLGGWSANSSVWREL